MAGLSNFFNDNIVGVFFFHGLALFLMGTLVTLESRRGLSAGLPRILGPLGAFGLLAGLSEWVQMFTAIPRSKAQPSVDVLLHQIQPSNCLQCHLGPSQAEHGALNGGEFYHTVGFVFLLSSAVFLVYFGSKLLRHTGISGWWITYIPLILFLVWAAVAGLSPVASTTSAEWRAMASIYCRYFLYFPGAILAALGLWRLRRTVLAQDLPHAGFAVYLSAILFVLSGFVDGIVVAPASFPPASWLNYASFFSLVGIPVQLFRAMIVIGIAYCIVNILREWGINQTQQVIEALSERLLLQRKATENEARQREQGEHWNQELQRERNLRGEVLKRIITVQEDERKRVARELHDEMGQTLTALATGLEAISIALNKNPVKAREHLGRLQGFAQAAVVDVHRLIADLRPALLDASGLPPALRWYANIAAEQGNFEVRMEMLHWDRRLPSHLEAVLFRIGQEALTNVVRHAGARNVAIRLSCNHEVTLEVEDDGRGFEVEAILNRADGREAIGLLGMRERALLAGGTLDLISRPNAGCRVIVHLPALD